VDKSLSLSHIISPSACLTLSLCFIVQNALFKMKLNQHTLDQLESVLEEAGYVVRYERGTFQSGYCILEQKKVVVLNKFLSLEGRIQTVLDLLPQVKIDIDLLTDASQRRYTEVLALAAAKETAAKAA
jgi:hypothetical protein